MEPRSDPLTIAVCVITYHRPDALRRTLESLREQSDGLELQVVVVDNDPEASARSVCEAAESGPSHRRRLLPVRQEVWSGLARHRACLVGLLPWRQRTDLALSV